jgi:uncharacterized protein with PIN domain
VRLTATSAKAVETLHNFAYALAEEFHEPLRFKGDDFRRTDVMPAA